MTSTRRILLPLAAFAAGLIALVVAAVVTLVPSDRPTGASGVGGPFTLTDQDGRTVTERDFAGRPHLVFFGFTHCPDVCPTTLQQISDVLAALGDKADRLKVAFVTVDPERDTPAVLKTYLASFDPRITGLTGTPEQVNAALKAFRGFARKVPGKDGDYTMEHTALVYVMDARNDFRQSLNLGRPPAETADDLARML